MGILEKLHNRKEINEYIKREKIIESDKNKVLPEIIKMEQDISRRIGLAKSSINALKNVKLLILEQEKAMAKDDIPRIRATQERIDENLRIASISIDNLAYLSTDEMHQHPAFTTLFANEFKIVRDIAGKMAEMRHTWQSGKVLGVVKHKKADDETLKIIDIVLKEEAVLIKLESEMIKKFERIKKN